MPHGLQVIPSRLFDPPVRVDRRVALCAGERLVVFVRDVLVRLGVAVPFGQPEVDHVYQVDAVAAPEQEVFWRFQLYQEIADVEL